MIRPIDRLRAAVVLFLLWLIGMLLGRQRTS